MEKTKPEPLIHVVDDDAAMRRSVAYLADSVGWPVAQHASAEEFLAAVQPERPGCVVLDIRMPTMSGLELQQAMQERGIGLPVIFITGHADVSIAVQAMKRGAFEFLEKPFQDQALLDAVAQAVRASRERATAARENAGLRLRYEQLTPREREVAARVARGLANKVVARELEISEKTVQVHRAHVLEKMRAHSAAELARLLLALDPALVGGVGAP